MYILNDFFLLNWNEKSELIENLPKQFETEIIRVLDDDFEQFCDSCSILLIINSENFEKIINIKEFKLIFNAIFKDVFIDKCLLLQTQKKILELILDLGNFELNSILKENFETLRKEGVITYYISRRLIGLFGIIKVDKKKKSKLRLKKANFSDNFYKNSLNILQTSIENLKICLEIDLFQQKLKQIEEKIRNERFSVGVTGIINAGKSTMLNALLKKEILGTSVIPETANLTIMKYSKKRFARVNFWNKAEFSKIEQSANEHASIKKFINETKENFGNTLDTFIEEKGKITEVKIDNLALYTSAEKSNKKCNLVKSVELFTDLEFLKDGVEIVDTPGLDDPIIQREEITLKYVNECDLMIHLMNVNQSATKKDVDFIIDSVIYQNIARLLIVITRIDMVNKEDLEEVITYTKTSIENRLKEQNKSHKLHYILEKLDFIPISGKAALLLRTNQENKAQELGYDLQSCGILRVEEYLQNVLFGSSSEKANLIVRSNSNEILSVMKQQKDLFENEMMLLNKTSYEIKQEYETFKVRSEDMLLVLSKIKKTIKEQERELREYFKTLHKFSDSRLINLRDIVKVRIMDDALYEMRKNKSYPKRERIEYILENGIKDGLVDLIRDYRYEFQKKMQESFEIIKRDFDENAQSIDYQNSDFNAKEFLEKELKTFMVFQNREKLHSAVNLSIKKYVKNSPDKLNNILQNLLKETMDEFQKSIDLKLKNINEELLLNFIKTSQKSIEQKEYEINLKINLLETAMQNIKNSTTNKKERIEEIKSKMEALSLIEKDLNSINQDVV